MKKLTENLYQMTTYIQPMDFTIHQYLLATNPAILFATGTYEDAKRIYLLSKKSWMDGN